jgi:hypothetical protein
MLNKDLSTEELAKTLEQMAAEERLANPLSLKRKAELDMRCIKIQFGIFRFFVPAYWLLFWKWCKNA